MRISNLFLFLLAVVLITSCAGDGDDVEGVWILDSFVLSSCPDDIPNTTIQAEDGCMFFDGERFCLNFTLGTDGMLESSAQYDDEPADVGLGSYTVDGNSMTFCFDGDCQELLFADGLLTLTDSVEGCDAKFAFRKS